MKKSQEFRCTEETAMRIKKSSITMDPSPVSGALGIPVLVNEDVPEGVLQFWQDGKLVREITL